MIDLDDSFFEKLIYKEIASSRQNKEIELNLVAPVTLIPPADGVKDYGIELPESLKEVYRQVEYISIAWYIYPEPDFENQYQIPTGLKNDPYLKKEYWDKGVSWGIVHEYLSGFINIQKAEDMLNPDYCKKQHFYLAIKNFVEEENPDDFLPFDICWDLTACLKRENGKILDNIWLVHADGRTIYDMKISIEKYMELCYKAKGFHYWQLVYVLKEETYEYYQLMKRYLPMLFPHVELDLSGFGM